MIQSELSVGKEVAFPAYYGERAYMIPFTREDGLPAHLAVWQKTVDQMLAGVHTTHPMYLMIDQSVVDAGKTQRRPGLHVDGNWIADIQAHGHGASRHRHPTPYPVHDSPDTSDSVKEKVYEPSRHRHPPAQHGHSGYTPELIILASDVAASRAVTGLFEGDPTETGDCSHIDVSGGTEVLLRSHRAYIGNVTMLHESLSVPVSCRRTLVRINVPYGFLSA